MTVLPFRLGKSLLFAALLWIASFVWGMIIFMIPMTKSLPSIPYVARNPALSFPLLVIWLVMTFLLAKNYLHQAENPASEGLKFGVICFLFNIILNHLVLVILLKNGAEFYLSGSLWTAYLMLIIVPWLIGRSLQSSPEINARAEIN